MNESRTRGGEGWGGGRDGKLEERLRWCVCIILNFHQTVAHFKVAIKMEYNQRETRNTT